MERGSYYDSCYARWANLYEHHDTDGWSYWDDANLDYDQDPNCHYNRDNAHHVSVLAD